MKMNDAQPLSPKYLSALIVQEGHYFECESVQQHQSVQLPFLASIWGFNLVLLYLE